MNIDDNKNTNVLPMLRINNYTYNIRFTFEMHWLRFLI